MELIIFILSRDIKNCNDKYPFSLMINSLVCLIISLIKSSLSSFERRMNNFSKIYLFPFKILTICEKILFSHKLYNNLFS